MNKVIICTEEYPSRVTMGAMIDFKRETGKDVNEIGADVEQLTMFMYCCVRSACRADKIDFALTFEQFADGINLEDFTAFQNGMASEEDGSCSILKPYSKKSLELTDVCRFSWDTKPAQEMEEEPSTQERFDEIRTLWNGD